MNALNKYKIYPLGDSAAVIDLGNLISPALNNKILSMQQWLRQHSFRGLKDVIVAYSSLTLQYDPFIIYNDTNQGYKWINQYLEKCFNESGDHSPEIRNVSIPVCYELGHDLEEISTAKGLSVEEIIFIHSSLTYRVYMLGFLPGFAYMGTVDQRIAMPRKTQPREKVEAGSVGIAGWQTGIYPLDSPGGWQIIGRTPLKLFDAQAQTPALLRPGDEVSFHSISLNEFQTWR